MQWQNQAAFYAELRSRGIFIHAPDDCVSGLCAHSQPRPLTSCVRVYHADLFAGGANKYCGWYSEMQLYEPGVIHVPLLAVLKLLPCPSQFFAEVAMDLHLASRSL